MSRLSEKLKAASGVVGRVSARIEAKADEVIAREPIIDQRTEEAFAPHFGHLDDAMDGLDALERELGQLSNGGPSLASGDSPAVPEAIAADKPIEKPPALPAGDQRTFDRLG